MGRALHIIVDAFYTQHYKLCKNKNISNVCKKNYTYEDVTIHFQEHYDSLGFCFYIYSYDGFLPKRPVKICKYTLHGFLILTMIYSLLQLKYLYML